MRRGAYVDRHVWDSLNPLDQYRVLARAVLRTAECPAVLSHISAAIEHGSEVRDVDLSVVHVTRLDGRAGRREAGVKQHRGMLTEEQIWERDGVSVVLPARSIVEVTTEQDVEHSLVVANSLLHLKKDVGGPCRGRSHQMRQVAGLVGHPHRRRTRRSEDRKRWRRTRTAHVIWSQRLPKFEPQYKIRDHSGQAIARVDFAAPTLGVFLEFDGRLKYVQGQQGKTLDELSARGAAPRSVDLFPHRLGLCPDHLGRPDAPERLARRIRSAIDSRRVSAG